MEVNINGKRVVLRERFPVREFDHLRREFMALKSAEDWANKDWREQAKIYSAFVESWDFDGDPADIESWGGLDTFSEFPAIESAIAQEIIVGKYEKAKNSEKGSTTP